MTLTLYSSDNRSTPEPETETEKCPVACASVTYTYFGLNGSAEVGTVSVLHYIEKISWVLNFSSSGHWYGLSPKTYTKTDDAKWVDDGSLEFSDQCF